MIRDKKRQLIVANWKCNPATVVEARKLFLATEKATPSRGNVDVVIACPYTYLAEGKKALRRVKLAAQDVFWEETGAYTGEVGPRMVRSAGASYVIVGHSERREHLKETNEMTNEKVSAALMGGLRVILCVGERSREGDVAAYAAFVKEEVQVGLRGVAKSSLRNVVIAYEPIWAVGSDEADTPERTLEMALYIRKIIADMYDRSIAQSFPVLYGGSVNVGNARAFLRSGGVDGLLVGRASLDQKMFVKIIAETNYHALSQTPRF